jgi:hypothetical protein
MIRIEDRIGVDSNVWLCMRERGKLVPGSHREGHNVVTVTGRNLLSKLLSWETIGTTDVPYTQRRVRWIGVGTGTQLEVTTVTQLAQATLAKASPLDYIVPINYPPDFPTSTSVEYSYEFGVSEISTAGVPVLVSEVGLFSDVNPASAGGTDDVAVGGGVLTTLDPLVATNPPVAYKTFESLTKTKDFTLEVRWTFRF